jgi:hypothetical protein
MIAPVGVHGSNAATVCYTACWQVATAAAAARRRGLDEFLFLVVGCCLPLFRPIRRANESNSNDYIVHSFVFEVHICSGTSSYMFYNRLCLLHQAERVRDTLVSVGLS